MYQKYSGVILKKHPFGEADEMLTIFTREAGKIRVKCRAVRKSQSRLSGHIQTLNEIDFEVARGRNSGPNSLPVLVSVRANSVNSYLREDLNKFAWALIAVESLYRITPDGDVNEVLYDEFLSFLSDLRRVNYNNTLVRSFQLRLLDLLGFGIDFDNFDEQERAVVSALLNQDYKTTLEKRFEKKVERAFEDTLERQIKSEKFISNL